MRALMSPRRRAQERENGGPCTSGAATPRDTASGMDALAAGAWRPRGQAQAAGGLPTHPHADGGWRRESRERSRTGGRGIFQGKGMSIKQNGVDLPRQVAHRQLRLFSNSMRNEIREHGEIRIKSKGADLPRQVARRPGLRPRPRVRRRWRARSKLRPGVHDPAHPVHQLRSCRDGCHRPRLRSLQP